MIFNASATHALRALAHLAANEHEEATLGRDLAEEIGVPAPYLAKVLATLARAGLLTASRGTRGGYRLAHPAEEIALIEIVEPFEGMRVRPGCLLQPGRPCHDDGACSAHAAWSEVKTVYSRFLETTTLADIQGGGGRERRGRGRVRQRAARTRRGRSGSRRTRV
jgi:Rrf2 family protein